MALPVWPGDVFLVSATAVDGRLALGMVQEASGGWIQKHCVRESHRHEWMLKIGWEVLPNRKRPVRRCKCTPLHIKVRHDLRNGYYRRGGRGVPHDTKRANGVHEQQHVCLLVALRHLGFHVTCTENGPFWVLRDGNKFLRHYGKALVPATLGCMSSDPGLYVCSHGDHCWGVRSGDSPSPSCDRGTQHTFVANASRTGSSCEAMHVYKIIDRLPEQDCFGAPQCAVCDSLVGAGSRDTFAEEQLALYRQVRQGLLHSAAFVRAANDLERRAGGIPASVLKTLMQTRPHPTVECFSMDLVAVYVASSNVGWSSMGSTGTPANHTHKGCAIAARARLHTALAKLGARGLAEEVMRRRRVWLSDIAQSPQTTYYNYDTMRCLPAPFKFIARADHFEVPNRFYMLQEDLYVGALLGMGKAQFCHAARQLEQQSGVQAALLKWLMTERPRRLPSVSGMYMASLQFACNNTALHSACLAEGGGLEIAEWDAQDRDLQHASSIARRTSRGFLPGGMQQAAVALTAMPDQRPLVVADIFDVDASSAEHESETGLLEGNTLGRRRRTSSATAALILFPTLAQRVNGRAPHSHTSVGETVVPLWQNVGAPVVQIRFDAQADGSAIGTCVAYAPEKTSDVFRWGVAGGTLLGVVKLAVGTYAVVKCFGENFFRGLLTEPAKLGEAAGHAGLACEDPVVFAGEVKLGPAGRLTAWTSVSGTYQIPDSHATQAGLPLSLYCAFVVSDAVCNVPATALQNARVLRGGHLLLRPGASGALVDARDTEASELKRARLATPEQMWEPHFYQEFIEEGEALCILPERDNPSKPIKELTDEIVKECGHYLAALATRPSNDMCRAILVVGLHVSMDLEWDPNSDLVCARLVGTLLHGFIRAHPDAIYFYNNGAFLEISELPETHIREVGDALVRAQCIFLQMACEEEGCVTRDWHSVRVWLTHQNLSLLESIQLPPKSHFKKHQKCPTSEWWANAAETLARLHTRLTNRHNAQAILELVGK